MTPNQNRHAIVFGCTGISGWALVNQLLSGYPAIDTFEKVTAISNRPFDLDDAQWPCEDDDTRLQIVSGLDLLAEDDISLQRILSEKVSSVRTVSHIYFAAYRESHDGPEECRMNKQMLSVSVQTIEKLSSNFQSVTLITGTKAYGVLLGDKFPFRGQAPLKESFPRIPEEFAKDLFYYHQKDLLKELSAGKTWSWCEVRPDIIIGIAPFGNANCIAQSTGTYLSFYREMEGPGARVPFMGSETGWSLLSTDSNQDLIAQLCIFASLQPKDKVHGQTFNVGDNSIPLSWSTRWPLIAAYFGLEGTGPSKDSLTPAQYIDHHWNEFQNLCHERGLREDVVYRGDSQYWVKGQDECNGL
ncbi:hypothetical protein N7509_001674 [Penicillium cosmopolitanum]|uniref:PRISE-like Rossmann-fold domain-containing protein n=1 Tax=Penicillium cosmopolitanum TaxID=1131564 RepID=A0A9X0BCP6_9EURO|nr:uncharacterized protein N7509_001674 [Penicillium cosmopolitanum]KAJ5407791.1 hypothetical protein N7509_001674 [Penicillium cosmopolitanum]